MSYEELEDIISRLRIVNRELRELSAKSKVLGSELSNTLAQIRRYDFLYHITTRNMYSLYGRVAWLEKRGLKEEAEKLRAEARMLYNLAQKYKKIVEELQKKVSEIRRELGRLGSRIRALKEEKEELERELYRLIKRYPYYKLDIGFYAKYPHVSGRVKRPYKYRRYRIPKGRMETWEIWVNVAIPTEIIAMMLEDERKRRIIESILYAMATEKIDENLDKILNNPEFSDALTSRMVRKGIDIVKPLEFEITPELYVEVLERKYRPPDVPLVIEWDNEELRERIRKVIKE